MEHRFRRVFVEVDYKSRSYRMGFDGGFTEAEQRGFMVRGEGIASKMLAMKNPSEPLKMTIEDMQPPEREYAELEVNQDAHES